MKPIHKVSRRKRFQSCCRPPKKCCPSSPWLQHSPSVLAVKLKLSTIMVFTAAAIMASVTVGMFMVRSRLCTCPDISNRTTRRIAFSGINRGTTTPRTLTTTHRRSNVIEITFTTSPVTTTFTEPDTGTDLACEKNWPLECSGGVSWPDNLPSSRWCFLQAMQ